MQSLSKSSAIELPMTPSQPTDIVFRRRPFGKTKIVYRSFQSEWFCRWKWLHYDSSSDLAYCFVCKKAIQSGKYLRWINFYLAHAHIYTGFLYILIL